MFCNRGTVGPVLEEGWLASGGPERGSGWSRAGKGKLAISFLGCGLAGAVSWSIGWHRRGCIRAEARNAIFE